MVFKKGQTAWNKGLTKDSDNRMKKLSKSLKLFYDTNNGLIKKKQQSILMKKIIGQTQKNINGKHTNKTKEKMKINHWTKNGNWTKNQIKEKIGNHKKGKTYEEIYGEEEAIRLKNEKKTYMIGRRMGNKNPSKHSTVRKKMRESAIKYIEKQHGKIMPRKGTNETKILNEIEEKNNVKIMRQYEILGYFIDGYCKETNTVYEIDEKPKTKERDIRREKEIIHKLNCKFIRIKDY